MWKKGHVPAFTLLEVLIVLGIVGLLAGISAYGFHAYRDGQKVDHAKSLAQILDLKKSQFRSEYAGAADVSWGAAADDEAKYQLIRAYLNPSPATLGDGTGDGAYTPRGFRFELNGLEEPTSVFRLTSGGAVPVGGGTGTSVTITAVPNNATYGAALGGGAHQIGAVATVTATPFTGYRFNRWLESGNPVSTDAAYSFTVAAGRSLVAEFVSAPAGEFTLTILRNNALAGTVSPGSGSYTAGASVTVVATPDTNWQFDVWTGDIGSATASSPSITLTMDRDRVIQAAFVRPTVTLSLVPSDVSYGTVSGGGRFPVGVAAPITATPFPGFRFVEWRQGMATLSLASAFNYSVSSDTTLTAVFALEPVTGVTPGTYGSATELAQFTVDAQGRVLDAQEHPLTIPANAVTGLGTMATQDADNVAITGGTITGVAFSSLNLVNPTVTGGTVTGTTINSTTIGDTNPASGRFTAVVTNTLQVTGAAGTGARMVATDEAGNFTATTIPLSDFSSDGTGAYVRKAGDSMSGALAIGTSDFSTGLTGHAASLKLMRPAGTLGLLIENGNSSQADIVLRNTTAAADARFLQLVNVGGAFGIRTLTADAAVGRNLFIADMASGNVAIGASPITARLHVDAPAGGVPASGLVRIGSTDYSAQANKVMLSVAPGTVQFDAPGVAGGRMQLDDVGLGVGGAPAHTRVRVVNGSGTALPVLGTGSGHLSLSNGTYGVLHGVQTNGDGWIQAQRTDGTGTAYNLLLQPSGGRVGIGGSADGAQLQVKRSGGSILADYNGPAYGVVIKTADAGGWARGYGFQGSTAGELASFAVLANANSLDYAFVGPGTLGYGSPWMKWTPDGHVHIGGYKAYQAQYNSTTNYRGHMQWDHVQLGNNGGNFIVAGNTQTGGSLHFVVNNSQDLTGLAGSSHNGTVALSLAANGNVNVPGTLTVGQLNPSGFTFPVNTWISSTDNRQRFHFGSNSHTYIKTADAIHFRNSGDGTIGILDANSNLTVRSITAMDPGGNSGVSAAHYKWGYQEAGAWTHPYPDLVLGYHTGVKIGGHYNYSGTRFYNDHPGYGAEVFSVANGDNNVRVLYDLIVSGSQTLGTDRWHSSSDGQGRLYYGGNSHTYHDVRSGYYHVFRIGGADRFYVTQNGAQTLGQHTAVSFNSTSSGRYKQNLRPVEDPLRMIAALRGVYFDWKDDSPLPGRVNDFGFIAEEVAEVLPQAVGNNANGEVESVDYSRLTPLLVEAVKALRKENESLREEIAAAGGKGIDYSDIASTAALAAAALLYLRAGRRF